MRLNKNRLSKKIAALHLDKKVNKAALKILFFILVVSGVVGICAVLVDRPVMGMGLVYLFIFTDVLFNQWKRISQLNRNDISKLPWTKVFQLIWKEISQFNEKEVSQSNQKEVSQLKIKKAALKVFSIFVIILVFPTMMWFVFSGQSWLSERFFEWPGAGLSEDITVVVVVSFFLMGLFFVLPWLSGLISKLGVYHAPDIEYYGEKYMRVGRVYALISVPLVISYLMYLRSLNMQFDWKGAALVIISTIGTLLIIRINSNPSKDRINCPKGVSSEEHNSLIKTHKERMLSFLFSLIFAQWILSIIALATIIGQDSEFKFGTDLSVIVCFIILFLVVLIFATYSGETVLRWRCPHEQISGKNADNSFYTPAKHVRPSAGDAERGHHTQSAGAETKSRGPCGRYTNLLNRRKQGRSCEARRKPDGFRH